MLGLTKTIWSSTPLSAKRFKFALKGNLPPHLIFTLLVLSLKWWMRPKFWVLLYRLIFVGTCRSIARYQKAAADCTCLVVWSVLEYLWGIWYLCTLGMCTWLLSMSVLCSMSVLKSTKLNKLKESKEEGLAVSSWAAHTLRTLMFWDSQVSRHSKRDDHIFVLNLPRNVLHRRKIPGGSPWNTFLTACAFVTPVLTKLLSSELIDMVTIPSPTSLDF